MLNIYYGSENIDKEKFLFKNIKGRTLLIVPDQFSLQAERDAFFYLKEKGLVELQIVDFSILGHKVVSQAAAAVPPLIDKYGRHMLLTKIVREHESELTVYKGLRGRNSFIGMLNSMISEMKRFEISPDRIKEAAEKLTDKGFLRYKLDDILKIYLSYEEAISGKYLDSEDYITFYGDKILNAPLVKGAEIWIYGFDTFTPKNMLVIERLLKSAKNVNVVMTYEDGQEGMLQDDGQDLFSLTGYVIKNLQKLADDLNEESEIIPIAGIIKPRAESDFIKKNIWNSYNKLRRIDGEIPVKFVETTDIYSEAERAAAYILELVRNEDYRLGIL